MAKSNYDGYPGISKSGGVVIGKTTRRDRARGAAEGFKRNYEGMRSSYETYKRPSEPSSSTTEKQIKSGSESAISRVQRTNRESDNERTREERRTAGNVGRPPMSRKWTE